MFIYLATFSGIALLALRIGLGALLMAHGLPKLRDLKKTAETFQQMGFRPGGLFGSIAALLEFFGGLALLLGFMTQPIALLFVLQFIVIIAWRLIGRHHFVGGWELDLMILCAALLLLSIGAGNYSADAWFFRSWI